jgi:hypothetical protein
MLRFCTRCGAATSSTAGAEVAGVAATATIDAGTVEAGTVEAGPVDASRIEVSAVEAAAAAQDCAGPAADQPEAGQPEAGQPEAGQPEADEVTPAELAADHPGPARQYSPAPAETALPTGMPDDAGSLRLVQIGAEDDHEPWPEDPWLPGSRRPDRRALIIGVLVIAGLLSVA